MHHRRGATLSSTNEQHLTVATVVEQQGRFLLVEERIDGTLCYNQPAGHVDPGEHPLDAALRETLEETGYEVELTGFLGFSVLQTPANGTYYRMSFSARAPDQTPRQNLDTGIVRAVWMTATEIGALENLRSPLVWQDIQRYLTGQSFPLSLLAATIRSP